MGNNYIRSTVITIIVELF